MITDLPVGAALLALARALNDRHRAVLCAPPGAGKSTVVPLALLDAPWRADGRIVVLEPRRIAARAVARRMAQSLGEAVGQRVGYRTRLESKVSRGTRVEVLTEGILTRLLQHDAALPGIACVIFDEFHERSLHADLGLALCLDAQETLREDLKILIMSATLDVAPLARLMADAPVIEACGRQYEVQTHYVSRRTDQTPEQHAAQVVRRALTEHPGDVLCFLPGTREIRRVASLLEPLQQDATLRVLPLYGELGSELQDAALAPGAAGSRKVVLATSIAETSLTIEGIRVVVDSGLRRYTEFDPLTGMSRLATGPVSKANADQRRGRAGRLSSGVCYRLWSESAQAALAAFSAPEIARADLAPLALELACWGSADAASLRWLEPPAAAPLAQARELLQQLGACDARGRITSHGRAMADAGAHPRLAHLLLTAANGPQAALACDIAAILSERDILRSGPGAHDADLRLRIDVLRGDRRDLPTGMGVDTRALQQAKRLAGEWRRVFARRAASAGDAHGDTGRLLALAYPDRIGIARGESGRYLLANGRGAALANAQSLSNARFIVAAELDDAAREAKIFLAAPIDLEEIEAAHGDAISTHAAIHWDAREQAVVAQRERRLGALVLERNALHAPDPQAVIGATLTGLRSAGIEALPWTNELRQWQARVALMRKHEVPGPEPWPELNDAALLESIEHWAPPWLQGITRREHFSRIDLRHALGGMLTHMQRQTLEREAPAQLVVPSGSRLSIDYLDGDTPSLSARLQEMFGLMTTPAVAAGRVPLVIKLLSPAGRPVQVTRDLQSFWNKGYHEVKKDLKGRYPKHYWPDDPKAAQPTRRIRPKVH